MREKEDRSVAENIEAQYGKVTNLKYLNQNPLQLFKLQVTIRKYTEGEYAHLCDVNVIFSSLGGHLVI